MAVGSTDRRATQIVPAILAVYTGRDPLSDTTTACHQKRDELDA